ncbi:F-box protein At3g07870-like [Mangifera indica]|uniref:F-box protein At3g07870-like n=1 Tax=Mangifera indica TaxID=29780 RepID=UPI001CF9FA97|nr:F-box protein At3g07870-like [Mangifera indica]
MEYLPSEVLVKILSRLPVTSLMQCKLVCRAWYRLTKDPYLASVRFSCVGENDPSLILESVNPNQNEFYSVDLSALDEGNLEVNKICLPTLPRFYVEGSCKGLLCLCDSTTKYQLYIYNLFTGRTSSCPMSTEFPIHETLFRLGFGFHPITKEYKVLKITYHSTHRPILYSGDQICGMESQVQIFTLGSLAWRSLGEIPYLLSETSPQVLVSGRLHWHAWPDSSIISFDLADEQFRVVPKPGCGGLDRCTFSLVALGGCLCAAVSHNYCPSEIWVMRDYDVKESWTMDFRVGFHVPKGLKQKLPEPLKASNFKFYYQLTHKVISVLCLMKNGNILLDYNGRALVSYDPIRGTFKDLLFYQRSFWLHAVVHVGNLSH